LPNEWNVHGRAGKRMLRDVVAADLPEEVRRARKRGFSLPLARWWREEAPAVIRAGLIPLHPALTPFLQEHFIAHLLDEHQAGRANHAQRLWNLFVLNEWARTFLNDK
jgi:asparagine synthase (glutamine-hydrolysing)